MISSDFKEKKSGRIELKAFSAPAVENMLRFLYGLELSSPFTKLDTLLEIAQMGALYSVPGLLQDALERACSGLEQKNDVFKVLQFAKQHGVEKYHSVCAYYISRKFSFEEIRSEESFLRHPDVLIEILRMKENLLKRPAVVPFFDDIPPERYLLQEEFSLTLKSSQDISVTGFGLFLVPGGKISVRGCFKILISGEKNHSKAQMFEQFILNKLENKTIAPMFLKDDLRMNKNVFYKITLETSCSDDGGVGNLYKSYRVPGKPRQGKTIKTKFSLGDENPFEEREVEAVMLRAQGRDRQGNFAGDVDFTVCELNTSPSPWAELYFHLNN